MLFAKSVPVSEPNVSLVTFILYSTLTLGILFVSGCAGSSHSDTGAGDVISVEGRVTYYGNTPFERAALVTDDGNWYILDLSDAQQDGLTAPSRQLVRGRVYLGDWNGRPFAHLDVHTMQRVNR
ncbi:MAG: hypothetical protein HKN17_01365 [Rhodothermales bacterium]|nr:hypothetical protein [Rhodothermales bacterium]